MRMFFLVAALVLPLAARDPLAQRIVHTDPAMYRPSKAVHDGAGEMAYEQLFDYHALDTNLYFLHRGVIKPKSGIGHHFHNRCEEMFLIFDGEAQFTIDGRTSQLKAPVGVPCRATHAHGIYNPTDKEVQWMNINVSLLKGTYDAFNLGDSRVDAQLDPIPVFMTMRLDRALLRPVKAMFGGKGEVQYRRALDTSVFTGPWAYVDQLLMPPGTSTGSHMHRQVAEFYYVMAGQGTVTVSTFAERPETAPIRAGDAIPIQLNDIHAFENTGTEPLEFMIVGVAQDSEKKVDVVEGDAMRRRF